MEKQKKSNINVLLTAYKRLENIDNQIESLMNQTHPPHKIYVWFNNYENKALESKYIDQIILVDCKENLGVWARFAFALNFDCDYIAMFDDDTIPGVKWFESCLIQDQLESGLFGTRGLRFKNKKRYIDYEEFGWNNPNESTMEVDIVGHSWFFKKEYIDLFWKSKSPSPRVINAGEDIHFSFALQMAGIKTFVPPHPMKDYNVWGSMPLTAIKLGSDENAISKATDSLERFQNHFDYYIKNGFQPYYSRIREYDNKIILKSGTKLRVFYYKKMSKNKVLKRFLKKLVLLFDKLGIRL